MSEPTTISFVEHVIWEPGEEWHDALAHLAERFARAMPLDVDAIEATGTLEAQLEALATWADAAGTELDRELGRWFDEHLAMHVRPAPSTTRAIRAIAADRPLHMASALPPRAAESIVRHAGCWRSVLHLHGDVRTAQAAGELITRLGATQVIAGADTPLPVGVEHASLSSPTG